MFSLAFCGGRLTSFCFAHLFEDIANYSSIPNYQHCFLKPVLPIIFCQKGVWDVSPNSLFFLHGSFLKTEFPQESGSPKVLCPMLTQFLLNTQCHKFPLQINLDPSSKKSNICRTKTNGGTPKSGVPRDIWGLIFITSHSQEQTRRLTELWAGGSDTRDGWDEF